ncbi:MAG: hypothetical protein VW985_13140 [Gammaproteobacteria bacterium]
MSNNHQPVDTNSGTVSDQCAAYINNRDRKPLSVLCGMMMACLTTTAFFLYHAVLNLSYRGGVPF